MAPAMHASSVRAGCGLSQPALGDKLPAEKVVSRRRSVAIHRKACEKRCGAGLPAGPSHSAGGSANLRRFVAASGRNPGAALLLGLTLIWIVKGFRR